MKTNTALITTHFTELSKLQKRTKKSITNYHFSIARSPENDIICSYKIKKGLSKDKIALELLKNRGFEPEIIESAINLCDNIRVKIRLPKNSS